LAILNSGVTGPKFTKLTNSATDQNGNIAIRFGMPWLRIKVNSPILPIFTLKLVTMAKSLEPSEIIDQICDQMPTIIWQKFGENRPSRS